MEKKDSFRKYSLFGFEVGWFSVSHSIRITESLEEIYVIEPVNMSNLIKNEKKQH